MKLVVGLGNPGRAYERTRHNVGFRAAEALAKRFDGRFRRSWRMPVQRCRVNAGAAGALTIAQPLTFMNRSGDAVAPLLRRSGLGPEDLVLVFDDVDLDLGTIRLRARGGAGGHNGVRSVMDRLGTGDFARVRLGVGRDTGGRDLVEYVLGRFAAAERETVDAMVERAADAVCGIAEFGVDEAMNRFNGSKEGRQ